MFSRHVSIVQSLNAFSQASTKLLQKMLKMDPKWHYGKHTLIGKVPKIKSLRYRVMPNSCVKFERNRVKRKSSSLSGDKHTYIDTYIVTNERNTRLSLQLLKRRNNNETTDWVPIINSKCDLLQLQNWLRSV